MWRERRHFLLTMKQVHSILNTTERNSKHWVCSHNISTSRLINFGSLKPVNGSEGRLDLWLPGTERGGKNHHDALLFLTSFVPDSGSTTWNGKGIRDIPRHQFGYLPEERGLYPKVEVQEQLVFLARLNGLSKAAAIAQLDEWLERF